MSLESANSSKLNQVSAAVTICITFLSWVTTKQKFYVHNLHTARDRKKPTYPSIRALKGLTIVKLYHVLDVLPDSPWRWQKGRNLIKQVVENCWRQGLLHWVHYTILSALENHVHSKSVFFFLSSSFESFYLKYILLNNVSFTELVTLGGKEDKIRC